MLFTNRFKFNLGSKLVNLSSDVIKILLMQPSFSFNIDTHVTVADVTAFELATAGGYVKGTGVTVTGQAWAQNNNTDKAEFSAQDMVLNASGANIGPSGGYCLYDLTAVTLIGYQSFSSNLTAIDGSPFRIQNIGFTLS